MTTMTPLMDHVRFIVDAEGKTTAAVIDIDAWEALLDRLEEVEDMQLARERLQNWRDKRGWTPWEDAEAELDAG